MATASVRIAPIRLEHKGIEFKKPEGDAKLILAGYTFLIDEETYQTLYQQVEELGQAMDW